MRSFLPRSPFTNESLFRPPQAITGNGPWSRRGTCNRAKPLETLAVWRSIGIPQYRSSAGPARMQPGIEDDICSLLKHGLKLFAGAWRALSSDIEPNGM